MQRATSHLLVMLLVGAAVFLVGAAQKAPCATESFAESHDARFPCYTDLAALLGPEQLAAGRVPYLDACVPSAQPCDEYPVLTMYTMYAAARAPGGSGFFATNAALMLACALVVVWALERMGARTVLFAAAPTLALYGALNWDLLAVAAATVATLLLLRGRSGSSGVALGIGAAAKLYPALLMLPFAWYRVRQERKVDALRLVVGAVLTWLVLNLPFAIGGTSGWLEVFSYNRARGADFESLWQIGCRVGVCPSAPVLNALIPVIVVVATWWVWQHVLDTLPEEAWWFLAFPMLVIVVVTGKFWSPQYALWLLPWFALSRIPVRIWLAYQLAEVLEFVARSGFMMGSVGSRVPLSWLLVTVALRAVLLLRCLWWWMHDPEPASGVLRETTAHAAPLATTA